MIKIARYPYYRRLTNPVTDAEWSEAQLANAQFGPHRDDPDFRLPVSRRRGLGRRLSAAERILWRIRSESGWWSVFGKKRRGKRAKVDTPARDDLVRCDFSTTGPNRVWLSDITDVSDHFSPAVVATPA